MKRGPFQESKPGGRVFLVGAGPGDPELLTVRAVRLLGGADLVLYDALVDTRVLDHAPKAHRFYVGKRSGRHAMNQTTICQVMVDAALAGRTVVRLKAGDPFVFGRGGEEMLACVTAGVPVEVVPGVTSAIAAPLSLGIPVTHRGTSGAFLVLSAVPSDHYRELLPPLAEANLTIVMMMAMESREEIARFLLASSYPADLPSAVVLGAHTKRAWSWTGRLSELGEMTIPEAESDLPGLIVLGNVVSLGNAVRAEAAPLLTSTRLYEENSTWQRRKAL